mgnify:FL=1
MNTNRLKTMAAEARTQLMTGIQARLHYVRTTDSAEIREQQRALQELERALQREGEEALVERVAYTWFNRLVALRFMDVNDYQPGGIRVVSPREGFTRPQLLEEARAGRLPADLPVDTQLINDLLDGRRPSTNPENEVYRLLLMAACNQLHQTFPFLFEPLADYTELLLPADVISPASIVHHIRTGMPAADGQEVEVLGWLYQFYISEKKDAVFAKKGKVTAAEIPAATQLFTPRWIVEYMVQNSLGRLWLQSHPQSSLRDHMPYYLENPEGAEDADMLTVSTPEDLTLLDPACGSGHILVYAFELLSKIYEEEGYAPSEIAPLILEHNLYGLEIDQRAAQLAAFALLMKARSYHRRALRKVAEPHIVQLQSIPGTEEHLEQTLQQAGLTPEEALWHDLQLMREADNYGSLIIPTSTAGQRAGFRQKVEQAIARQPLLATDLRAVGAALRQLDTLGRHYHCVVANPPYMGSGKMNKDLSAWVKKNYPKEKSDLFSCFISRCLAFSIQNGLSGLVTMESWMFLSSFEKFRKYLLDNYKILSLSHFGWHIMRIAFGTVSFILEKDNPGENHTGIYSYTEIENIDREHDRPKIFPVKDNGRYNTARQRDFGKIPGSPVGYWVSGEIINSFEEGVLLSEISAPKKGLATTNNNRFLRFWMEIERSKFGFGYKDSLEAEMSGKKWFPLNKGGGFRKWYGNKIYVINWLHNGEEIKKAVITKYKGGSYTKEIRSEDSYFKDGITWSALTSGTSSFRLSDYGALFDSAGSTMSLNEDYWSLLGLLNSPVIDVILKLLNPTLNYGAGTIAKIPVRSIGDKYEISEKVKKLVQLTKSDWDINEISWDFKRFPILRNRGNRLKNAYDTYVKLSAGNYDEVMRLEEEVNNHFIQIYCLQSELSPELLYEDITILQQETSIVDGELVFHKDEIMAQFVSYAVGCMFGRYSLDKEGLILANQGEGIADYLEKIGNRKSEIGNATEQPKVTFMPDDDNIIPVLDEEWFEDDIVSRFRAFLRASFGEEHFHDNLAFVEECLGTDIRSWFVKKFYPDHIKRYKKRPIYWLFASPSGAFQALVYLHRYTPDTLNNLLNNYLRVYMDKLRLRLKELEQVEIDPRASAGEKSRARKQMDKYKSALDELETWEREVVYPLASARIAIDLDDGVLVNYNKFGRAVKEVKGLNDAKAKKKVRGFDWIDVEEIRD